ncbi:6-phosphofructo-2-kinase/fructose-2,6-bisphosphatase [Physcomitrium patens]|uniref:CBM20 domain-containing protein n=1 Tax=Physcomitrium patens TaxID=3218 RepID=A0A2K1J6V2_PHYPA|nr:6-phosphofructo-2-kinase/fructose-2,6-bisphosphatase-like [Physcomitrium patens]PNR37253.1 hypothetical protein PHYPA_020361 [Physcomitrium patens]|eukprot:XP_024399319.1 6-phosphofructo-2-kinase/fructose-2,6-bisphosphatase-like [Physcomitrella patens]
MGNSRSVSVSGNGAEHNGGQLFVSLKLHKSDGQPLPFNAVPHITGSLPIVGLWDPAKATAMEGESSTVWELSFVVPSDHDTLEFKFVLKPTDKECEGVFEEGPNRILKAGVMSGGPGPIAKFILPKEYGVQMLELPVSVATDPVSPFALAASWRALKKNIKPYGTRVLGIPDVSLDQANSSPTPTDQSAQHALELDIEHYEVPPPGSVFKHSVYAADATEFPRGSLERSTSVPEPFYGESRKYKLRQGNANLLSKKENNTDRTVSVKDLVAHGDSESVSVQATIPEGVGALEDLKSSPKSVPSNSPRIIEIGSDMSQIEAQLNEDAETEESGRSKSMPEAAGAVAAAAVADRLLGAKERRQLAIVLVGLPARGKTFTAAKLTRYLRWLGHDTKHFNVGKYRRLQLGCNQSADFFRGDNQEGIDARNEVAALAMEDMLAWMEEGGQVGVFDATNSTNARRNMLMKLAEGKCKIIFLETICNDRAMIDTNIELKIQQSPDYADMTDYEVALQDFKARLSNYEKMYEPVTEGSYIKMIDMVSGRGKMEVNSISGYLPGRIVFFLVNTHITARPILLTRHGESQDNVRGRLGGDPPLSEAGEKYSLKLADFVHKRLKNERTASIWTSTLQRTLLTARHIVGFPKVQWRALDEINSGVCDGMTYLEVKETMPEDYLARKQDKLRYRYPRGESYLDVIQRLEPVIIELERQRSPVVVIAHQAILRSLYAYFADKPLKEVPHIEMPLHTIIEIQMGVTGVQEKRYKLMETQSTKYGEFP